MAKYCVLYNPKAGSGTGEAGAKKIEAAISGAEFVYKDVTAVSDWDAFFAELPADQTFVLSGGDGTINHFVNDTEGKRDGRPVLYFPAGTGNDFLRDIGKYGTKEPVDITQYLENLPTVTVNGMTRKFINGIGYGIDGYCCEVGDRLAAESDKPINYAGIAIKGLLGKYDSTSATVTVDGVTKTYDHVWLAPTMYGRYYGGGMMAAPEQNRLGTAHNVACMVWHNRGRLTTLAAFPSIFKGEHVKKTKQVELCTGKSVTVKFDRPVALQIDGETVLNVTEYSVSV